MLAVRWCGGLLVNEGDVGRGGEGMTKSEIRMTKEFRSTNDERDAVRGCFAIHSIVRNAFEFNITRQTAGRPCLAVMAMQASRSAPFGARPVVRRKSRVIC